MALSRQFVQLAQLLLMRWPSSKRNVHLARSLTSESPVPSWWSRSRKIPYAGPVLFGGVTVPPGSHASILAGDGEEPACLGRGALTTLGVRLHAGHTPVLSGRWGRGWLSERTFIQICGHCLTAAFQRTFPGCPVQLSAPVRGCLAVNLRWHILCMTRIIYLWF